MAVELFTIQCLTCRVRLKVNDEAVIGQILACPKCGSMVHVAPPEGWQAGTLSLAAVAPAAPLKPAVKAAPAAASPPAIPARPSAAQPSPAQPSPARPTVAQPAVPTPSAAPPIVTPPVASTSPVAASAPAPAAAVGAPPSMTLWQAAVDRVRHDWMILSGSLLTGVLLGGSLWYFLRDKPAAVATIATAPAADAQATSEASSAAAPSEAQPTPLAAGEPAAKAEAPAADASATPAEPEKAAANNDRPAAAPANPPEATETVAAAEPREPAPAVAAPAATEEPPKGAAPALKLEPAPSNPPAAEAAADVPSALDTPAAEDETADAKDDAPVDAEPEATPRNAITLTEVTERLAQPLPGVEFSDVPLSQFVQFVSELANLPITFDDAALKTVDKSRQSRVTIKLSDTTAGEALRKAVAQHGLTCSMRGGKLVVTVPKAQR